MHGYLTKDGSNRGAKRASRTRPLHGASSQKGDQKGVKKGGSEGGHPADLLQRALQDPAKDERW